MLIKNSGGLRRDKKTLTPTPLPEVEGLRQGMYKEYRLKDITTKIGSGATPKGGHESYQEEGIPLIRSLNVYDDGFRTLGLAYLDDQQAKKLSNVTVQENDVLLNITGASVARCCIVPSYLVPARVNQHVSIIRVKPELVDSKFLSILLTSKKYKDLLLHHGESGSTRQAITKLQLEEFVVSLPPLPEQKRIVAILDEAFANISQAVANAEKNLANARELFDSYLNEVFSQSASQSPSQTLTELTELIVDCEHKTAPTQDSGYPSIRTPNIGKGELLLDGVYRVSEETYKIWTRRAIPKAGDLILAREAPAGNVGVVPQGENVCLGQRTVLIRPKLNIINSEYLAFLMLHPIMQKRLLAGSTGATVQHVNVKDIRALGFGTLPSKTFQNEVVHKIKAAKSYSESLEDVYRRKLAALAELKQALLQKAFTGELTANHPHPQ